MNKILIPFILLFSFNCYGQTNSDDRIIVTVNDTIGLYEKVRLALVKSDFMVKDGRNLDTLTTYPLNIRSTTYILALASIKNNTVTFWGYFGESNINLLGATVIPSKKYYSKILYFKGAKYWKKLVSIAQMLDGTLSYSKDFNTH